MTRHTKGAIKPWEWDTVPLAWHEWVFVSMGVTTDLNTPTVQT